MLGLNLAELGRPAEARAAVVRAVREIPGLNIEGLALLVGTQPDRERGRVGVARLREYWPKTS